MAEVNIYKTFFEKKIMPFMKKGHLEQEKLVYYLKLYTHLITAVDELKSRRGFDRLKIVADLTSKESYAGEVHYIKYINTLVREIMHNKKRIQRILSKDPAADALYARTKLLMAQNICVIRILKLNGIT